MSPISAQLLARTIATAIGDELAISNLVEALNFDFPAYRWTFTGKRLVDDEQNDIGPEIIAVAADRDPACAASPPAPRA